MKKVIICCSVVLLAIGAFFLLKKCGKKEYQIKEYSIDNRAEYTATIKNILPQSFYDKPGEMMSAVEFKINEATVMDEGENNFVNVHLKGEVTSDYIIARLLGDYELDYKVYKSGEKEIESDAHNETYTIDVEYDSNGKIDFIARVDLGSEPGDYTIEFLQSTHERKYGEN